MCDVWIEIFFDAEDVDDPIMVGTIKDGLWKICVWKLDENKEPIIEGDDTGMVIADKLKFGEALNLGRYVKNELKSSHGRTYLSGTSPKSFFKIMPVHYELLGYEKRSKSERFKSNIF